MDLLDTSTYQYYEVKSIGAYNAGNHIQQLNKYDVASIQDTIGNCRISDLRFGAKVTRGDIYVSGFFNYGIYDVSYYTKEAGVIVYEAKVNEERLAAVMAAGAALLLLGLVPESAPATLPTIGRAISMLA